MLEPSAKCLRRCDLRSVEMVLSGNRNREPSPRFRQRADCIFLPTRLLRKTISICSTTPALSNGSATLPALRFMDAGLARRCFFYDGRAEQREHWPQTGNHGCGGQRLRTGKCSLIGQKTAGRCATFSTGTPCCPTERIPRAISQRQRLRSRLTIWLPPFGKSGRHEYGHALAVIIAESSVPISVPDAAS